MSETLWSSAFQPCSITTRPLGDGLLDATDMVTNVVQALIFFFPHLFILAIAPELWGLLPVVFAWALVFGY